MMAAPTEAPARVIRGPAAERLREQMLDQLGARTAVLEGLAAVLDTRVPPTRLDATDVPVASVVADQDAAAVRRLPSDVENTQANVASVEDVASLTVPRPATRSHWCHRATPTLPRTRHHSPSA